MPSLSPQGTEQQGLLSVPSVECRPRQPVQVTHLDSEPGVTPVGQLY